MLESLFINILSMSTIASVVFLIILCARKLIKNKVNIKNSALLWVIFIIVLIIPLNFQSKLSIKNFLDTKDSFILTESKEFNDNDTVTKEDNSIVVTNDTLQNNTTEIFASIWFVVAGIFIVTDIFIYRSLKNKNSCEISENILKIFNECKNELNIQNNIKLVVQEKVNMPSLYGILNSQILLTKETFNLSENEFNCIILHELNHYKSKHHILYLLFGIIEKIHWFNPVIKLAFKTIKQDLEIITDRNVLNANVTVKEYCKTILKIAEMCSLQEAKMPSICSDKKEIERRIIQMKNNYIKSSIFIIVATILIVSVLTISLASDKVSNATTENDKIISEIFYEIESEENIIPKVEYIVPVEYTRVSSTFGTRVHPITKEEITHTGIDLVAEEGTKVKAAADGIVETAEYDVDKGNYIEVRHIDGSISGYHHGEKILVEVGDNVKQGDEIMTVGKTGKATGAHLHFEVKNNSGEYMDVNALIQ